MMMVAAVELRNGGRLGREGVGKVGAGGEEWKEGGGGERADGRGRRKVVISQLLINILRLRAFQRNVIN